MTLSDSLPRGIFLSIRLPEDHHSIFTLQAKLNHTTSTAGGFETTKKVPVMLI